MPDFNELNELHVAVRSRILERIQTSLQEQGSVASTMYTKSDGTNYGMYQKGDSSLTDVWNVVVNQQPGVTQLTERVARPQGPGA